jgi:hypothetical protein
MGASSEPETLRLHLSQWKATDEQPFAALNADTAIMKNFPKTLTREESDAMADQCEQLISDRKWGCRGMMRACSTSPRFSMASKKGCARADYRLAQRTLR